MLGMIMIIYFSQCISLHLFRSHAITNAHEHNHKNIQQLCTVCVCQILILVIFAMNLKGFTSNFYIDISFFLLHNV